MTSAAAPPTTRMRGAERRELVLDAAMSVFGDFGYVGTTTEQVARAAGVSQPYVIRMFGTKERLFLAVLDRAVSTLLAVFRSTLASSSGEDVPKRIGSAYVDLLRDRGLLLTLMHAFVLGSDPVIGDAARTGFLSVYRFLREEAGFDAEASRDFLAQGMLINTMIGLRLSDDFDSSPEVRELMECAFPEKLDTMLSLAPRQDELP